MTDAIATIRAFNRFYTQYVGALDASFLDCGLTLGEARLLFEISHAPGTTARDLQDRLDIDAGHLSRVLRRFEGRGWITRPRSAGDARRRPIDLTAEGQAMFAVIDTRMRGEVQAMLDRLPLASQRDLVAAMATAHGLLDAQAARPFAIRVFRPGDLGMIAARQSILYNDLYGWGRPMEVLQGEVTTAFLRDFKPGREQCWVAEVGGRLAGSVMLTDEDDGLARLRLMYVEPFARGLGIGNALVGACVGFAREVGYDAITLWTHTILESARRIYAGYGFTLVETHMHDGFGERVQGETWRLDLRGEMASAA